MAVRPRRISDIKPLLTNLAQTSHYEVQFGALPPQLVGYLNQRGIDSRFIAESAGLLCYEAVLPSTNFGSFTVDGNFMGIQEKFVHSRIYSEITLSFYVDSDYKMLNFLECWMEFIASGSYNRQGLSGENNSINPNSNSYFTRIQYPQYYKANAVKILKFDRDYRREIEYNFRGLFPLNLSSVPVTYMNSDALKVSASFQFDRYIAGKVNTFNQFIVRDNNNQNPTTTPINTASGPSSADELLNQTRQSFEFISNTTRNSFPRGTASSQANSETLF